MTEKQHNTTAATAVAEAELADRESNFPLPDWWLPGWSLVASLLRQRRQSARHRQCVGGLHRAFYAHKREQLMTSDVELSQVCYCRYEVKFRQLKL